MMSDEARQVRRGQAPGCHGTVARFPENMPHEIDDSILKGIFTTQTRSDTVCHSEDQVR